MLGFGLRTHGLELFLMVRGEHQADVSLLAHQGHLWGV